MYAHIVERIKQLTVTDDNGCWIWQGRTDGSGYGDFRIKGTPSKTRIAHRISYEVFVGRIPAGKQIDHLCRVRACINPEHLEPVTPQENTRRSPVVMAGVRRLQTACKYGHEYSEANTRIGRRGYRWCRQCDKRRLQEQAIRRAEARARQTQ